MSSTGPGSLGSCHVTQHIRKPHILTQIESQFVKTCIPFPKCSFIFPKGELSVHDTFDKEPKFKKKRWTDILERDLECMFLIIK